MRTRNCKLLLPIIFFCVAVTNACSPPDGILLPVVEPNQQITDTRAKNDTIELSTEKAVVKVFGNWRRESVGGATIYDLTFTIENKSEDEIRLNLGQLGISADENGRSTVGAVNVLQKISEIVSAAGSNVPDSTIIVKPRETKIFRVDYKTETSGTAKTNATVNYIFPAAIFGEMKDVILQFKVATDYEPLPTQTARPAVN